MKCPCCKGFGKLDVPHRPNQSRLLFGPAAPGLHGKGAELANLGLRVSGLVGQIEYLAETVRYLTARLENPVCPHCNGTGEVEAAGSDKAQPREAKG